MSRKLSRSSSAKQRFERETRILTSLSHAGIVRALDAGVTNDQPFLVMELVDGVDLANWLRQNGPLPWEQAATCILRAAEALEYAHAQGIIHRDIKPGNLMLLPDGNVKLLDLGLARLDDPTDELLKATTKD